DRKLALADDDVPAPRPPLPSRPAAVSVPRPPDTPKPPVTAAPIHPDTPKPRATVPPPPPYSADPETPPFQAPSQEAGRALRDAAPGDPIVPIEVDAPPEPETEGETLDVAPAALGSEVATVEGEPTVAPPQEQEGEGEGPSVAPPRAPPIPSVQPPPVAF